MPSMYAVVAVIAIALVARIVGALIRTGDPNALWRHKARFAAGRIGWCLAVAALAACSSTVPSTASPPFAPDPAYATCAADPGPNDAWCLGAPETMQTYFCTTPTPMPPGYGCTGATIYDAGEVAPASILCCPLAAFDAGTDGAP